MNPSDFVGSVIGQSEANTKAVLATTLGKVLIIDEAYMLYPDSGPGAGSGTDIFKTAVIDTIVAEVQNIPGDDRCVLLLGYEPQMVKMFQNVNPGLTRRFQMLDAFRFEDFSDPELQQILQLKLKGQDLSATPQAISTAIDVLGRLRNGLNFGNGGDVENILSKAKANYHARQSALPASQRSIDFVFEPEDFDLNHDRSSGAETNLQALFAGVIGCDDIIRTLDGFLKVAKGMRAQGLEPRGQIPMNLIFKGPPGKCNSFHCVFGHADRLRRNRQTTTARKFGQVYYDLGFLSQVEVVECSATDLIGQYVGQTGPKTIKQLERGLGKVLFIDEAYRLGEGSFAQEAINELVDTVTKPQFAGKLVIILAGYDNDMNNLLRVNEGLSSRFADEIIFPSLSPGHCLQLLKDKVKQSSIAFPSTQDSDIDVHLLDRIEQLSKLPAWGNARDVQTLAKSMVRTVYQKSHTKVDQLLLSPDDAMKCVESMLVERRARAKIVPTSRPSFSGQVQTRRASQSIPQISSSSCTAMTSASKPETPEEGTQKLKMIGNTDEGRDPGVSDAIWQSLQDDKKLAELRAEKVKRDIRNQEEAQRLAEEAEKETQKIAAALLEIQAKNEAEALELLRKREEARIREMEAKAERERIQREVERMRQQEAERKAKEERVQTRLRQMGVCPVGFRWIKQASGYRCAGGSHWVDESSLGV
jgi:hypothetical protein